jgi:hypothetical protein
MPRGKVSFARAECNSANAKSSAGSAAQPDVYGDKRMSESLMCRVERLGENKPFSAEKVWSVPTASSAIAERTDCQLT